MLSKRGERWRRGPKWRQGRAWSSHHLEWTRVRSPLISPHSPLCGTPCQERYQMSPFPGLAITAKLLALDPYLPCNQYRAKYDNCVGRRKSICLLMVTLPLVAASCPRAAIHNAPTCILVRHDTNPIRHHLGVIFIIVLKSYSCCWCLYILRSICIMIHAAGPL